MNKMRGKGWLCLPIIFLLIVQILFSIPAPCKWLEAVWGAGDFISFVGTIFLGYITISQTERANKMAEKMMEIENDRYKMEIRPFFLVEDWKAYELSAAQIYNPAKLYICIDSYDGKSPAIGVGLHLQNTTSSYISVEFSNASSSKGKWRNSLSNQPNRKLRLNAGTADEIVFYACEDFMNSQQGSAVNMSFILENRFGERYQESFDLYIISYK